MSSPDPSDFPPELQLERILSLREAAMLNNISVDTLRRRYGHLIRKLSPRRDGVKLRDALSIARMKYEVTA
jgi:hypothetical protein